MDQKLKSIFVTIGHPNGDFPIANKVEILVDEEETYEQVCKKFRKQIADNIENWGYVKGTKMKASELYWEAFIDSVSTQPIVCSDNSKNKKVY